MKRVKALFYLYHQELRTLLVLALVFGLGAGDMANAQTVSDPWSNFTTLLTTWITGNLGKTLTLIGILASTIVAILSHSFKPLVYGIIFSVILGGLVGIARTFFEAGSNAFGSSW